MKTVTDLRDHLFAAMQGLRDKSMTIEQAEAIAKVGQVVVNSAKVEAQFLKDTGQRGSGFIPESAPALPSTPGQPRLVSPMGRR